MNRSDLIKIADLIHGGKADNIPDSAFDKGQLAMGARHEMEHTVSKVLAKEIATDHLSEDPKYYTHLKKVEKMAIFEHSNVPEAIAELVKGAAERTLWDKLLGRRVHGKSNEELELDKEEGSLERRQNAYSKRYGVSPSYFIGKDPVFIEKADFSINDIPKDKRSILGREIISKKASKASGPPSISPAAPTTSTSAPPAPGQPQQQQAPVEIQGNKLDLSKLTPTPYNGLMAPPPQPVQEAPPQEEKPQKVEVKHTHTHKTASTRALREIRDLIHGGDYQGAKSLVKLAVVSGPVKGYRRMLEAMRIGGGYEFHGTRAGRIPEIIKSKGLLAEKSTWDYQKNRGVFTSPSFPAHEFWKTRDRASSPAGVVFSPKTLPLRPAPDSFGRSYEHEAENFYNKDVPISRGDYIVTKRRDLTAAKERTVRKTGLRVVDPDQFMAAAIIGNNGPIPQRRIGMRASGGSEYEFPPSRIKSYPDRSLMALPLRFPEDSGFAAQMSRSMAKTSTLKLALHTHTHKTASTRALREIRDLIHGGDYQGAKSLVKKLSLRGGLKLTNEGSQVTRLGSGLEGVAHTVVGAKDAPLDIAVRKSYDTMSPMVSKQSLADKMNVSRWMTGKPEFASLYSQRLGHGKGGTPYTLHEYVHGPEPTAKSMITEKFNTPHGRLEDVRHWNVKIDAATGKPKIIDFLPEKLTPSRPSGRTYERSGSSPFDKGEGATKSLAPDQKFIMSGYKGQPKGSAHLESYREGYDATARLEMKKRMHRKEQKNKIINWIGQKIAMIDGLG